MGRDPLRAFEVEIDEAIFLHETDISMDDVEYYKGYLACLREVKKQLDKYK
jgi:hypothetical protein